MNSPSVALICHSVGPYHLSRFAALKGIVGNIAVIQLFEKQITHGWQLTAGAVDLPLTTLFGSQQGAGRRINRRAALTYALERLNPDVVVTVGYSEEMMRIAARWTRGKKKKCIMMTDTWKGDKRRLFWTEAAKSLWCRTMYDSFFLSGIRSFQYFRGLGIADGRLWRGVDAVDIHHFSQGAEFAKSSRGEQTQKHGLPAAYFLVVARLSEEKNLERLLEAYGLYRKAGGTWSLVIAGDGPLKETLRKQAESTSANVKMAGWVQYEDLPVFYGLAEAFILPSISESWGLAVNEAMASGLPILISRKCGCFPELCWRGINGYDFNPFDAAELAGLMRALESGDKDLARMGEASRRIISTFSINNWVVALADCISTTLLRQSRGQRFL